MALLDDVRNLASVPAFGAFEHEALRLIAFSAETRILRAGDVLFRRDDPADSGFVVLSGRVTLEDRVGRPPVIVVAGTLIGETALMTDTRRPATATAREPSSVLKITRPLFRRVLSEFPGSAVRVRSHVERRLAELRRNLEAFATNL